MKKRKNTPMFKENIFILGLGITDNLKKRSRDIGPKGSVMNSTCRLVRQSSRKTG
jgi:hypothetical protein